MFFHGYLIALPFSLALWALIIAGSVVVVWMIEKPMLQRLKRKRGGQPGNKNSLGHQNALKHGRYSPRIKAIRAAERRAREAEERKRFEAWVAPIRRRCRAQHASILAELERERAERALTEPDGGWGPVD